MLHDIGSAHLTLASGATIPNQKLRAITAANMPATAVMTETSRAAAAPWDCGPIGNKTAVERPKADCIYTCIQPEDLNQLDSTRKALMLAQVAQWGASNPSAEFFFDRESKYDTIGEFPRMAT